MECKAGSPLQAANSSQSGAIAGAVALAAMPGPFRYCLATTPRPSGPPSVLHPALATCAYGSAQTLAIFGRLRKSASLEAEEGKSRGFTPCIGRSLEGATRPYGALLMGQLEAAAEHPAGDGFEPPLDVAAKAGDWPLRVQPVWKRIDLLK
jgi:hypothetical protein